MLRKAVLLISLLTAVAQAWKPVGQLTGNITASPSFPANTELTQFREDGNLRKFTHENGRLIAQKKGYYYIYAQVFFETYPGVDTFHNRVALSINGHAVSLMQSGLGEGRADYGSVSTGVVNYLKEGDYISLKTEYPSKIWMSHAHTFFGAYRVRRRA